MKYIVYAHPIITPSGVIVACYAVPSSISAFRELKRLGLNILGIDFTEEQAEFKAFQHDLAINAQNYSSN